MRATDNLCPVDERSMMINGITGNRISEACRRQVTRTGRRTDTVTPLLLALLIGLQSGCDSDGAERDTLPTNTAAPTTPTSGAPTQGGAPTPTPSSQPTPEASGPASGGAGGSSPVTPTGAAGSPGAGGGGPGAGGGGPGAGGDAPVLDAGASGMGAAPGEPETWTLDDVVSDVNVSVHEEMPTILVVTWTQSTALDSVWLEFSAADGELMTSPARTGAAGEHREVVLGLPEETQATIRIVGSLADEESQTRDYEGATEALPAGMPRPELVAFEPDLASPDRFMLGAVEDSDGGCNNQSCYYHTTFWVYIMNRQGQMVWFYADPASNATTSFQRIARDGQYLWLEKRPFNGPDARTVLKTTLDREYSEEIPVEGLSDCIDVTDDGSLLYDVVNSYELREMNAAGDVRTIWSCPDHFGGQFICYSNTINWNPADDSILLSFPYERTVIQIDRQTGDVVGQYGDAGGYAFSPSDWEFEFQHFANITPDGTLLVSTHLPGLVDTEDPVAGGHAFVEFSIDRESETLTEEWVYNEGSEWAMYKGMAIRLENGNTLANYGTGGVIREITPDLQTAFEVKFDAEDGDDFFNKMVGHNVLIDDLYSINGGPAAD